MPRRTYFVRRESGPAIARNDVYDAMDEAERISLDHAANVTVCDDRGRVFAFFCEHGGMRDSTMGALSCCEEPETECEGHPAGPFEPMGQTVFCNGTCRS